MDTSASPATLARYHVGIELRSRTSPQVASSTIQLAMAVSVGLHAYTAETSSYLLATSWYPANALWREHVGCLLSMLARETPGMAIGPIGHAPPWW